MNNRYVHPCDCGSPQPPSASTSKNYKKKNDTKTIFFFLVFCNDKVTQKFEGETGEI